MQPEIDTEATVFDDQLQQEAERQRLIEERTQHLINSSQGLEEGKPIENSQQKQTEQPQQEKTDDKVDTIGEVVGEVKNAIVRGVSTAAEDVVTLPERLTDMVSGEYQEEESQGGYEAEFNPFSGVKHPLARTWWGSAIETVAHFGSLATGVIVGGVPLMKATAARVGLGGLATFVGGNLFAKGAVIGGTADFISRYSEDDNITSLFVDKVPILEPLATKEDDHVFVKKFKNVVEGMGIGGIIDYIGVKSGGLKGIVRAFTRAKNQAQQITERGLMYVGDGKFNGWKNKKIADPWQGTYTSTGNIHEVYRDANKITSEFGLDEGATDSIHTAAEQARLYETSGELPAKLNELREKFMSDEQYEAYRESLRELGQTPEEVFPYAFERMRELIEGRNLSEIDSGEFWAPFFENQAKTGGRRDLEFWAIENVVAADLINGALFRELRDLSIASREIFDVANVLDTDGPMSSIAEKLTIGLSNTKRSRYILSNEFRQLQRTNAQRAAETLTKNADTFHQQAKDSVQMMMEVIGKDDSDELLEAVLEAFSMSNKIQNFQDFDAFMRSKIRGGEFRGKVSTGQWIKELQGVMVNSILSGPKTPLRAIMGTSTASFLRPATTALGHVMRRDGTAIRASLAATNAYVQAVPEAWKLFKTKLGGYWAGDISQVKTRFSEYNPGDEQWELMRQWSESPRASDADKAAFRVANLGRSLNNNSFLTYSTKMMAATDDSFRYLMARARAREKAMKLVMENNKVGSVTEINPQVLKEAEDSFLNKLLDADGNVRPDIDAYLEAGAKEATLTTDLSGFAGGLEELFNRTPWAKPFFLFARTGINGLALTAKNTPLLNYVLKSQRDIFSTKLTDDLTHLLKYGIENADDLANAKALAMGRQAIGGSVIFIAGQHFMNGNLTGNGPQDRQKRQFMVDSGWKPRSFRVGDVWVSYESMEPFNQVLAAVADIGDNMKLMGPEWAEMNFARAALIVGQGATSKTYMQGLSQLVDLLSGESYQWQKIVGGIANNTLPLGGLRNEIGKVLNPGMRELSSHIFDAVRNRNLLFEYGPGQDLPKKYDILNGEVIKDWWFPHQLWESVVPISISLSQGPGRTLLFNSNYDLRTSTYSAPDGTSLRDSPVVRSKFQQALGALNLEKKLNELALRPDIQASVAQMESDLKAGRREIDPMKAYNHNKVIKRLFTTAKRRAWASLRNDPDVQALIADRKRQQAQNYRTLSGTRDSYSQILQLQPK